MVTMIMINYRFILRDLQGLFNRGLSCMRIRWDSVKAIVYIESELYSNSYF